MRTLSQILAAGSLGILIMPYQQVLKQRLERSRDHNGCLAGPLCQE
jgi:hypothetical protein